MTRGYITTGKRPEQVHIDYAKTLAVQWGLCYIPREKHSIETLLEGLSSEAILIAERDRLVYKGGGLQLFWHPSTAKMATGELEQLGKTALMRALALEPADHIIDGTFGLGSDALRIAMALGKDGRITGLEAQLPLALLATEGLKQIHKTGSAALIEAAGKIELIHGAHLDYLKGFPSDSADVVYFDPMFEKPQLAAHSVNAFRSIAVQETLSEEAVEEAIRVCRRRVVIKERFGAKLISHPKIQTIYGEPNYNRVVYGVIKKDF